MTATATPTRPTRTCYRARYHAADDCVELHESVMAADTNCSSAMPDVTGTNFILATDLSGPLAISQIPTNGAIMPLGTNTMIIAVTDLYSNTKRNQ